MSAGPGSVSRQERNPCVRQSGTATNDMEAGMPGADQSYFRERRSSMRWGRMGGGACHRHPASRERMGLFKRVKMIYIYLSDIPHLRCVR